VRRPTPHAVGSDPPPPPSQRLPRWIRRTFSRRRLLRPRDTGCRPWRPLPRCREVRRLPARVVSRRAQGLRRILPRSLMPALREVKRQTLRRDRRPHHGNWLALPRSRHPKQYPPWHGRTRPSLPRQPSASGPPPKQQFPVHWWRHHQHLPGRTANKKRAGLTVLPQ
jgi:hypothetical protein